MKTVLNVYIEGEVWEEMHNRGLNLSKTTEEALRQYLGIPDHLEEDFSKIQKKAKEQVEAYKNGVNKK